MPLPSAPRYDQMNGIQYTVPRYEPTDLLNGRHKRTTSTRKPEVDKPVTRIETAPIIRFGIVMRQPMTDYENSSNRRQAAMDLNPIKPITNYDIYKNSELLQFKAAYVYGQQLATLSDSAIKVAYDMTQSQADVYIDLSPLLQLVAFSGAQPGYLNNVYASIANTPPNSFNKMAQNAPTVSGYYLDIDSDPQKQSMLFKSLLALKSLPSLETKKMILVTRDNIGDIFKYIGRTVMATALGTVTGATDTEVGQAISAMFKDSPEVTDLAALLPASANPQDAAQQALTAEQADLVTDQTAAAQALAAQATQAETDRANEATRVLQAQQAAIQAEQDRLIAEIQAKETERVRKLAEKQAEELAKRIAEKHQQLIQGAITKREAKRAEKEFKAQQKAEKEVLDLKAAKLTTVAVAKATKKALAKIPIPLPLPPPAPTQGQAPIPLVVANSVGPNQATSVPITTKATAVNDPYGDDEFKLLIYKAGTNLKKGTANVPKYANLVNNYVYLHKDRVPADIIAKFGNIAKLTLTADGYRLIDPDTGNVFQLAVTKDKPYEDYFNLIDKFIPKESEEKNGNLRPLVRVKAFQKADWDWVRASIVHDDGYAPTVAPPVAPKPAVKIVKDKTSTSPATEFSEEPAEESPIKPANPAITPKVVEEATNQVDGDGYSGGSYGDLIVDIKDFQKVHLDLETKKNIYLITI